MDKKTLDEQRSGSDLHGLIEKAAFLVWISNASLPQQTNWETAKTIILESGYCCSHGQVSTPEEYHHTLEWTANNISNKKGTDQDTSWYLAQEHWATQLFNNYDRKRTKNY